MIVMVICKYMYMNDQSLRLGKAKQLRLKTTPFFSREKEELYMYTHYMYLQATPAQGVCVHVYVHGRVLTAHTE